MIDHKHWSGLGQLVASYGCLDFMVSDDCQHPEGLNVMICKHIGNIQQNYEKSKVKGGDNHFVYVESAD